MRLKLGKKPTLVVHYARILAENDSFCKSNSDAREASTELMNLMDEAKLYTMWENNVLPSEFGKTVSASAMATYLSFIFRPLAFGVHLDFLAGNVVAVFMQLRTLLEQLAKCYQADTLPEASEETFFQNRLLIVEKMQRTSLETVKTLGAGSEELWRNLSNQWVHMRGMKKLVSTVIEDGVPGHTNIIPVAYGAEDLSIIREISQDVKHFRILMSSTLDKWQATYRMKV